MTLPTDARIADQWYIYGETLSEPSGNPAAHINVEDAWDGGYHGAGVKVGIVFDEDLDYTHHDLDHALNQISGYTTSGTPTPGASPHGTRVVGVMAMDHNGDGGAGIAHDALYGSGNGMSSFFNTINNGAIDVFDVFNMSYGSFPSGIYQSSGII